MGALGAGQGRGGEEKERKSVREESQRGKCLPRDRRRNRSLKRNSHRRRSKSRREYAMENSFKREFANSYTLIFFFIQQALIKLPVCSRHCFRQQGHMVTNQA